MTLCVHTIHGCFVRCDACCYLLIMTVYMYTLVRTYTLAWKGSTTSVVHVTYPDSTKCGSAPCGTMYHYMAALSHSPTLRQSSYQWSLTLAECQGHTLSHSWVHLCILCALTFAVHAFCALLLPNDTTHCLRMWIISVLFFVKVTLCFHRILPHYRVYTCDCTWFTHNSIEQINKNAILFSQICTNCRGKYFYTYRDTSKRLHKGLTVMFSV